MEVDRIGEAVLVAESSAAHFDHLDAAVDAFCRAIADLEHDGIEYSPQVFLDHPGHFLDGL